MVIGASLLLHEGIVHRPDFRAVVTQMEHKAKVRLVCLCQCKGVCGGRWFLLNNPEVARSFEKHERLQPYEAKLYLVTYRKEGLLFSRVTQARGRLHTTAGPAFASGVGGRRQSHSHSSVHCGRKGKRLKTKTQMVLRSSRYPLPVSFGSAGGALKETLRAASRARWLGRLTLAHKNWQPFLHICVNKLECIFLCWSP